MATLIKSDLEFILQQILIAEAHAAGADLTTLLPNAFAPLGLRTVDGSLNNLLTGQNEFGAADNTFPLLLKQRFRNDQDGDTFDTNGPATPGGIVNNTNYATTTNVVDADPRIISNLIVDQTITNPAAVQAFVDAGLGTLDLDGTLLDLDGVPIPAGQTLTIPNTTPDEGLSAPFNAWFTFFGQFFDHGLDLVQKSNNVTVFIPLQADDPLITHGPDGLAGTGDELTNPAQQFMLLTRAANIVVQPGPDGLLNTADDVHLHNNQTSPFVDQNQTYTSHPAHQVFLREYELRDVNPSAPVVLRPFATGQLITNRNLVDGEFGNGNDIDLGGMATWGIVKAQARDLLGIQLSDQDALNVPMVRVDAYGNFLPGANGFAQLIVGLGADGIAQTADDALLPGNPAANGGLGVSTATALRTGHMFLADIAHSANPFSATTGLPLTADADLVAGVNDGLATTYDNELLAEHFMAGDGRVNENIALTAVHHMFHAEHNRQVEAIKTTILASGDAAFIAQWQLSPGVWDGERLFQAAKFATEMQYQHLVFEEFARKVQPQVDAFLVSEGYDAAINPAIVAEFAHTVYRFGHSMLLETVDRLDPNFASSEMDLITAFLNPLAYDANGTLTAEEAAGAIVRGTTRQGGSEIDEFKTEALRNNLLGLPLDLATINLARGRDTGVPSLNAARREFYAMTADSQLTPYTSWLDFVQHLKHPESVVNFIAAYGTHAELTAADVNTLAEKRAVATALVFGGSAVINASTPPQRTFVANEADRLAFLNSTGAYANLANGATTTGVDDIDFWIGGLAEKQMPFGGLLGSTFNFVFETQLENLQNGDRFYYLSRLAGLNFLTELENNSFGKLIMANTDATHLPADVFSTPAYILEVDPTKQFTGLDEPGADEIQGTPDDEVGPDGIAGNSDPVGGTVLLPLVMRDNPATPGADTNYLRYTGADHVVLGGTAGDDIIVSSIGDDTLYGDGGNDRLEGGDGVDNIEGGDGDDIITDLGGDDVLKGNAGNDVIHGGNGFNLILGGDGNDFIITGEDVSETFGGQGNDFILGAQMNLPTFGNEGDDWIEIGTSDGAGGDNFVPLGLGTVLGHDVFITAGGFDEVDGEGGDDIMVGSDGEDHFDGGGGFDWASYKFDPSGVNVDLNINDFFEPPVAPSNQGLLDRFGLVEGLSGSAFNDVLRGDDADADDLGVAGPENSVLTNIALIDGLQAFLGVGVTSFDAGNIILGGDGSDIIEGRGGDDLIDGDRSLNVRISVRTNVNDPNTEFRSVDSMQDLVPDMLSGVINPGQLAIVREILTAAGPDFDTAVFSGPLANYTININNNLTPLDFSDDIVTVTDLEGKDGTDRLTRIERLQFADQSIILVPGLNNNPVGLLTIDDSTPAVHQVLTVSAPGVTDADNPGGVITGPISFHWQFEVGPGSGIFEDIVGMDGADPMSMQGNTFQVTPDLDGLRIRARAVYQDANGVLENVFSAPTLTVDGTVPLPPAAVLPAETPVASTGIRLIRSDLQFIFDQIVIAERHAAGEDLVDIIPNSRLPFGLRTVDGSFNNLVEGQEHFGAADENFPLLLEQQFRDDQDGDAFGPVTNTNYASTTNVADADPRIISNLIVDQTITNPAAVQAFVDAGLGFLDLDGTLLDLDGVPIPAGQTLTIPNTTPDEGLSAPFNAWFTFFGQFFDHGLDLVQKGGNGTVFIPLQPDDPLITHGPDGLAGTGDELTNPAQQFMMLTRATNTVVQPGPDTILGTADDVHLHNNQTSPFVDQNQTYTSHPAHQAFLRAYQFNALGDSVATGKLLVNRDLGADGEFGTADDTVLGGMATWEVVKAQARDLLGIELSDYDALNVPLVDVDAYGNFRPGLNGFARLVRVGPDLLPGTADDVLEEGNPAAPITTNPDGIMGTADDAVRTGHMFLADIAHSANPFSAITGLPLTADVDLVAGGPVAAGFYDNELLEAHFMAGDGRVNENIALTAVHHVFHAEHNRLVDHIKDVILASNDPTFVAQWQLSPGVWDGERLFQAAKFGTEMQYQHLVFEEFARKVQPQIDVFLVEGQGYDTTINPSIVAEFAHTVYRFGHSMLLETVDRFDPNFASSEIGLITSFLNPLAFDASGTLTAEEAAGAIVRGTTRQVGNEIDEFKTEALRNNLLGLPLDLAAINLARGRDTGVPSLNAARMEFYDATGDSQLKPYASWVDFAANLRHESSVINFIAAYGTHVSITGATTLADKRAAATLLVLGGAGEPLDRLDFLHGPAATTGVDDIDFWIGGLAEKQMPFGGLLGSTFNFVFENQLEKLQNGDRFYYLERTSTLNFFTELENNSFAKLIMANTDTTHLPGDVFTTPAYILEVDQARQFTDLGLDGRADPLGTSILTPLVMRNTPATPGADTNYLQYTGEDHVVLGGTNPGNAANPSGNDIIISSIGDDTLYGDGGNDRLEGGDGVDIIFGGDGDDIITDLGGDDNIQGGAGNDAIHAGNGLNLVLGGFGNDFIITGEDSNESFGGPGNDFIFGFRANEMVFGNEGDDWIEGGMADGSAGENFDVRGLDTIIGHDVFIGSTTIDRMGGEGGDDIMVGNGGQTDRYLGASGFDWAVFKDDPFGVVVDLTLRAFDETPVPLSAATTQARFESVEGLSGSAFDDILRGDAFNAAEIAASGATGSVLTNIGLIDGLQTFLGVNVTSFGAGNIIMGGPGSDLLQGRGGRDVLDGDAWLNVRLSVRSATNPDVEIQSANSMTELQAAVFAGTINPGQIRIVREILTDPTPGDIDIAVFAGVQADYDITVNPLNDLVTVTPVGGGGGGGVETLRNIERMRFLGDDSDLVLSTLGATNRFAAGTLRISDTTPNVGQALTVTNAFVDLNGFNAGAVTRVWQSLIGTTWTNIAGATGTSFTPTATQLGRALRVVASFTDNAGNSETIVSGPTAKVNAVPTGLPTINDTTPAEDQLLTASTAGIADTNGLSPTGAFSYQWQALIGATWTNIADATNATLTPGDAQVGRQLRVVASYTDVHGTLESVTSAATAVVTNINDAPTGTPTISDTTPAEDQLLTASTLGIADGDGLGPFSFQWQASLDGISWSPIAGATAATFTPGDAHVGRQLRVVVSYTDLGGDGAGGQVGTLESLTSAATAAVLNINDAPTGAPTINDTTPAEDQLLTASTAGIADADGLGAFSFQWQASLDGISWSPIAGATAATFTPGDAHVGQQLRVVVSYTDLGGDGVGGQVGTLESVPSAATAAVLNINDTPTGTPTISDTTPAEDQLLTASTAGIADADGLGTLSFLWQSSLDGTTWTPIAGATTATFTPGAAQIGQQLRVVVSYTDLGGDGAGGQVGQAESVTSLATTAVTAAAGVTLIGTTGNDTLTGTAGNDIIRGGAGTDTLNGLAGNDQLFGEGGTDTLNGGDGDDTLDGGAANDILHGGNGNDTLIGGTSSDTLNGDAGNDNLSGGDSADTLNGGDDDDILHGDNTADILNGGAGNDNLFGDAGDDTVTGGAGNDTLQVSGGGNDIFVFDAPGFGNDTVPLGFDATGGVGAQDLLQLDQSALGVTAATFAASVSIAVGQFDGVGALDTRVTINTAVTPLVEGTILLLGVNGVGTNAITQADFILVP